MSTPTLQDVEDEILRLLDRPLDDPAEPLHREHHDLWNVVSTSAVGGKRLRPALLLAAHDAFGGRHPTQAVRVAAAIEVLHTGFVIQDDVIDGDLVRRGRPTVTGAFAARARTAGAGPEAAAAYGDVAGILAGDLALVTALRGISACGASPALIARLMSLVEVTVHATVTGELAEAKLQLAPEPDDLDMRAVLGVAEMKTAVYSFRLPLLAGAMISGTSDEHLDALDEVGSLLGIGFQLVDDLLGMFGDERRTGKSALGDLREGKRTALITHAVTTPHWPQLRTLMGRPDLEPCHAEEARELLTACGSRAWAEDLARQYLDSALDAGRRHRLPPGMLRTITTLTEGITASLVADLLPAPDPVTAPQEAQA